jgi:asparagine synthetase B (glutamine-hydrolysing)
MTKAQEFRTLLLQKVEAITKEHKDLALLFSGGTDSSLILFCLLELGIKPVCYTFGVEGYRSRDVIVSQQLAQHFGVKQQLIMLKPDVQTLERDVRQIIRYAKTSRKTVVQCLHPIKYVMQVVKEPVLLNGLNADSLYGTSRKICIEGKDDKEAFDRLRYAEMYDPELSDFYIKRYVESHGIVSIDPYRDKEIEDFFLPFTWREVNEPKEKQIAVDAFQDYFGAFDFYRRSASYQIESKLREYHDLLLAQPHLNLKGWKIVKPIYDLIYSQEVLQAGKPKQRRLF